MHMGEFGWYVPTPPMFGPPKPHYVVWHCVDCDVHWKATESVCWCCGSTRHVAEYGSPAALEAAQTVHYPIA